MNNIVFLFLLISSSLLSQNKYSNKKIDELLNMQKFKTNSGFENSLHVFNMLNKESKRNNYKVGLAYSYIGIAQSLAFLHKYKDALYNIEKGKEIAKRIHNDSLVIYSDYVAGFIYNRIGLNEKAVALINNSILKAYSLKQGDGKNILFGLLYTSKADFLSEQKKPRDKDYLFLHRKAFNFFSKVKKTPFYNPSYDNLGNYFLHTNQLDSAQFYFNKSIKQFIAIGCTPEFPYSYMGELNLKLKKYSIAQKYLDSSIVLCQKKKNYYLLSKNYSLSEQLYNSTKNYDKVLRFQNLACVYRDSVQAIENKKLKESFNFLIKTNEVEKESLISKYRLLVAFSTALGFLVCIVLRFYIVKKKKLKEDYSIKEVELEVKSSEIIQLKQKVKTSYEEVIEMAKKNNPLFLSFFKELYPDFYSKLIAIQPNLTLTEKKVCFYIKLKFSTKEIADYTFVTTKAIQNRKNRLRKRLNIPDGVDIYVWFNNL